MARMSQALMQELGLLDLQHKNRPSQQQPSVPEPTADSQQPVLQNATAAAPKPAPKLDKHEFRLLVKILQAIGHDCQYDAIEYDGQSVTYQLNQISLKFHDINTPDHDNVVNLSSLSDLIKDPSLKRPVWEKLKRI